MRKVLATFLALCLFTAQASAGWLLNSHRHGAVTITFIGCNDSDGADPNTISGANVGTAAADRTTIIGITAEDGAASFSVSSVTVGGDAATEVADEGGTFVVNSAIYVLSNPSGTSEDIVIDLSEAVSDIDACVWAVYGLQSLTPVDTASASDTASGALDLSVDTTAGGIVVAVSVQGGSASSISWTGVTTNGDNGLRSAAHAGPVTSGSTPLTVTADWGGAGDAVGSAASFR